MSSDEKSWSAGTRTSARMRSPLDASPTLMVVRRAGVSLLANLIESKCDHALPIHRQRDRLQRLGFDIPLNTSTSTGLRPPPC
jgi:hypothetical protein